jgi:hypothetical protein
LQALFMTANQPPVRSTATPRTIKPSLVPSATAGTWSILGPALSGADEPPMNAPTAVGDIGVYAPRLVVGEQKRRPRPPRLNRARSPLVLFRKEPLP